MIFIVHSYFDENRISSKLGAPEYSYYFVLKKYLPVLRKLGEVRIVANPGKEVDPIYRTAREQNVGCIFLSFRAPHNTVLGLECPTIAVFPWEFDSIPTEVFDDDARSDWMHVFANITGIITHSDFTVEVLRERLEVNYPLTSVPAPVWDTFQTLTENTPVQERSGTKLLLDCRMLDSRSIDLEAVEQCLHPSLSIAPTRLESTPVGGRSSWAATRQYLSAWYREALLGIWTDCLRPNDGTQSDTHNSEDNRAVEFYESVSFSISDRNPKVQGLRPVLNDYLDSGSASVVLSGLIYTTVLNPNDGRKNWHDIVCAFCLAFKETPDTTLVLKLIHRDSANMLLDLIHRLCQLAPFKCRVLVIDGFLDAENFGKLIRATTFVVNASHGEGQCLPMMEFMSAGTPAIAPAHTGMKDYIDDDVAFVVDCSKEPGFFPHDPRAAYRTCRFRINWQSLIEALKNSYNLVKGNPAKYTVMAQTASTRLQAHCSEEVVQRRLERYFNSSRILCAMDKPLSLEKAKSSKIQAKELEDAQNRASKEGWFIRNSRELFKGFKIESDDVVLDMDSTIFLPSLYCADLGVKLLLHGTDREILTTHVELLERENTHYFRALLSQSEELIPFLDKCASKILLLESLQYKADPLAYLKEAVRVGQVRAQYLISAPIRNRSEQSVGEKWHCWSPEDFAHLVTVAGLHVDHQQTLGSYWGDLRALEFSEKTGVARRGNCKGQLIVASKQTSNPSTAD